MQFKSHLFSHYSSCGEGSVSWNGGHKVLQMLKSGAKSDLLLELKCWLCFPLLSMTCRALPAFPAFVQHFQHLQRFCSMLKGGLVKHLSGNLGDLEIITSYGMIFHGPSGAALLGFSDHSHKFLSCISFLCSCFQLQAVPCSKNLAITNHSPSRLSNFYWTP